MSTKSIVWFFTIIFIDLPYLYLYTIFIILSLKRNLLLSNNLTRISLLNPLIFNFTPCNLYIIDLIIKKNEIQKVSHFILGLFSDLH